MLKLQHSSAGNDWSAKLGLLDDYLLVKFSTVILQSVTTVCFCFLFQIAAKFVNLFIMIPNFGAVCLFVLFQFTVQSPTGNFLLTGSWGRACHHKWTFWFSSNQNFCFSSNRAFLLSFNQNIHYFNLCTFPRLNDWCVETFSLQFRYREIYCERLVQSNE